MRLQLVVQPGDKPFLQALVEGKIYPATKVRTKKKVMGYKIVSETGEELMVSNSMRAKYFKSLP